MEKLVNLSHHRLRNKEVDLRSNFALYFTDYSATNISEYARCHKCLVFSYIWKDYFIRTFKINKSLEIMGETGTQIHFVYE